MIQLLLLQRSPQGPLHLPSPRISLTPLSWQPPVASSMVLGCCSALWGWVDPGRNIPEVLLGLQDSPEQSCCARHCPSAEEAGFYKNIIKNMKDPGTEYQQDPWSQKLPGAVFQGNPPQESPEPWQHGQTRKVGSSREFGSGPLSKSPCCAQKLWHH